jgi:hypothetical protein
VPPLLETAKQAIEARARRIGVSFVVDAVALVFVIVALFFFTYAGFVLAADAYGPVAASLLLGGAYMTIGAVLFVAARRISRRGAPNVEPARLLGSANAGQGQEWMVTPVVIASGIEILRRLGAARFIPVFALTAVAVAAAQTARSKREKGDTKKA